MVRFDDMGAKAAADEFDTTKDFIQQQHVDCGEKIHNTKWEGEAAERFKQKADLWLDEMCKITSQLNIMADKLRKNVKTSTDTETANEEVASNAFF